MVKQEKIKITVLCWKLFQTLRKHMTLLSFYILLSACLAVMSAVSARLRTGFINMVLEGTRTRREILGLLAWNLLAVFLLRFGLPALKEHLEKFLSLRISLDVEMRTSRKKCAVPWTLYEDPKINDRLELLQDTPKQLWLFLKGCIGIVSSVVSILGIFLVMLPLGIVPVLLLFLLFIPVTFLSVKTAGSYYDTWKRTAGLRRYCDYQRGIMMGQEYAMERILFEYAPYIMKHWKNGYQQVRSTSIREELKGSKKMQLNGLLFCFYIAVLTLVMIWKLGTGQITAGFAASMVSIFPSLMDSMIVTLSNELNRLARAAHAVQTFVSFEELEEEKDAFVLPDREADFSEIVLRRVSFRYPDSSKWILKDVDMCFEKGKQYAIVGENGAGKSTLIKLLLGLYRVTEGEILIDGINIDDIPRAGRLGLITALFQDHQHYYTDVSENIGLGDIRHIHDSARIMESAVKADFHERIARLPDGYETILGTMHKNGTELSGGEWQKLAVSRLVMSPCPVKILDEPTAAMDPVFEYKLYRNFNKIMQNRTSISISHRIASCKNAHCIYVMDNGTVPEQGTHEELLANGQLYHKMYTTQKEMYMTQKEMCMT